jgi:chemotaxis protein histidine kinase CheA
METSSAPASAAAAAAAAASMPATSTAAPVLPASLNRSNLFLSFVDNLVRTSTLIDIAGESGLPVGELGLEWATHLTTMFKTTKELSVKITRQLLPKKDKITSGHQSLQIRRNQTVVTEYMHLISSLMERATQTQTFLFDSLPKLLRHAKAMEEAAAAAEDAKQAALEAAKVAETAEAAARKAAVDAAIEAAAEAARKEATEAATPVAPPMVTPPASVPMSCVTPFGPMPTAMSMSAYLMMEELKRLRSLEQTQHTMQLELEKLRAAQTASILARAPPVSKQGAADGVDVELLIRRHEIKLENQKKYREKYKREKLENLKNSTQASEKTQQPQQTTLPLSAPTQSSGYVPVPAKANVLAHPVPTAAPATDSLQTGATKPMLAGTTTSKDDNINIDNWMNLHLVPKIHIIPGSDSTDSNKEGASAAKRTKPTA